MFSCYITVQVFAQRYPRYLLRVVNRHEEFYAAIMFFVERHYLRKHSMCRNDALGRFSWIGSTRCIILRKLLWAQKETQTIY